MTIPINIAINSELDALKVRITDGDDAMSRIEVIRDRLQDAANQQPSSDPSPPVQSTVWEILKMFIQLTTDEQNWIQTFVNINNRDGYAAARSWAFSTAYGRERMEQIKHRDSAYRTFADLDLRDRNSQ